MAAEAKRLKLETDKSTDNLTDDSLIRFLNWCEKVGVVISPKVYVSKKGTVSDYGMLAQEDIEEGEVLFTVPRSAVLYQNTTAIHSMLEKEKEILDSQSGWVPLLLSLLYEVTNSESHWKQYFSLWPDFCFLNHPMFWSEDERQRLLSGTSILEAVHKDIVNIQHEYNTIVLPFMKSHPEFFDPQKHTLELYKKLVAFVMAYSFQEPLKEEEEDEKDPNPPMMVPVADLLNHVANHNANLEYASGCLKMVCVRAIHRGEEVFNTYGELANWQLLHMYGFAEPFPTNTNDAVDIQMMTVFKAALQAAKTEEEQNLVHEKWHLLCQLEMVGEEGAFVIGQSEVLTEEELHTTLKVLTMSVEDFAEFKESEGWEEEDEDACTLSHNKIQKLKPSWKQLLHSSILLTLQAFSSDLEADKCLLNDQKAYNGLSKTEKYALHVRYGQKMLLHKLLQLSSC